jgi:hypothetical protein
MSLALVLLIFALGVGIFGCALAGAWLTERPESDPEPLPTESWNLDILA